MITRLFHLLHRLRIRRLYSINTNEPIVEFVSNHAWYIGKVRSGKFILYQDVKARWFR